VNALATPISGITADFDGDTRDAITPDLGADEYSPIPGQEVVLLSGWSGISSYIVPASGELDIIFGDILDDLIILQNGLDFYWPAQNVNTLGQWDTHLGYQIKVLNDVEVVFTGVPEDDYTLSLDAGWNLIPVISACDVDVESLIQATDVSMVKEVAGWNIYWPDFDNSMLPEEVGRVGRIQSRHLELHGLCNRCLEEIGQEQAA